MKITITNEKQQDEIEYPCLMFKEDEGVVLFQREFEGIIMQGRFGSYRCDREHFNLFSKFTGTITLEND